MNYLKEIKEFFIHLYYWLSPNTLIVQRSSKAIGDNLLLTIITSSLKHKYPTHKIIVETQFPEFFLHNPDVAFSTKHRWSKNKRTIRIKYHYDQFTNKSIYQQIVQDDLPGEFLVPHIYLKEEEIQKARELFPYPYICISPESKTDFAANRRDWGFDKFQELVNLMPQYRFVQVGNPQTPLLHYVDDGRYIDLILTAAIIKNSLLYIGNEGGLMHLAKSVRKLSAIILSGYIKPEIIAYPDNLNIYEKDIPCSPCGNSDVPHNNCLNRICLDRISPLRVKEAIESFMINIMHKHNELSNDLVSIIIPVHNAEKYLDTCITSIFAQTYTNIEVICVLDSCTDNSEAIIKQYPQIKIYKVDFHNVSKTRNYGIKRAKGAYIAFNDADDIWHPQRLEKQMQIFNQYPNVDLIFSEVESFNDQGNYWLANPLPEPSGIIPYPKILHLLLYQSYIKIQGVIVKKSALDNSGYFNELFTHCEDHELWMRLSADKSIFYYLSEVLAYYRQHDGSLISNKTAIHNFRIKAVEMILNREDLPNTIKKKKSYYLASHYRRGANLFYCERNYPLFKKNIRKAMHLSIRTLNSKDYIRIISTWFGFYFK